MNKKPLWYHITIAIVLLPAIEGIITNTPSSHFRVMVSITAVLWIVGMFEIRRNLNVAIWILILFALMFILTVEISKV
ncbi:hypothetical protein L3476_22290 [Paenibacillus thiaminolyticus]|uniref:hypothetical protein n=1 Tax=Paenibacillus thiaminolyticus TaxID=49283 RepID=UPI001163898F|nr:hypothetical protein [Paenibacillus thiaminolyticus]NGP60367.1 hypothetical protein [Paenibacillus thiaminolyticus]WCR25992.1 hypothetical protein L3476_22290 [Paenibacillus thiaminolyticus]